MGATGVSGTEVSTDTVGVGSGHSGLGWVSLSSQIARAQCMNGGLFGFPEIKKSKRVWRAEVWEEKPRARVRPDPHGKARRGQEAHLCPR